MTWRVTSVRPYPMDASPNGDAVVLKEVHEVSTDLSLDPEHADYWANPW